MRLEDLLAWHEKITKLSTYKYTQYNNHDTVDSLALPALFVVLLYLRCDMRRG